MSLSTPIATPARRFSPLVWWNTVFFTLLCASEIGFMAAALDWALAGLLGLPMPVVVAMSVALTGLVVWASYLAFRLALTAERSLLEDA
ncbi:hypothetical protein [Lutibaculum baratangense]|nr:hypothetical protein [Lutibaculum baratangense]